MKIRTNFDEEGASLLNHFSRLEKNAINIAIVKECTFHSNGNDWKLIRSTGDRTHRKHVRLTTTV